MPILHSFKENKLEYEDKDKVKIKMIGTRIDTESLEHNLYEDDITLIIFHNFSPTSNPPIKLKDSGNFRRRSLKIVMDNPNPENLNVPNEGVPEEDPHHLLDYDKEEDLEMDIEEEEPKEDPVEEPEPLVGHGDQFDAHPNPQPGNMNGWVDDDDDVEEEEDKENKYTDIEEDDDAEIIFPYEVQGDQTPPPRDESSDSDSEPEAEEADDEPEAEEDDDEPEAEEADDELEVEEAGVEPEAEGADVELEADEPDGVPEATIRTGSQRPFAVRDFPMGFYETGESSTARDPQFVGGLAPWALRRDLEALRRHERIRVAESKTSRTEIALLGSRAKIGKIEREILHHDLSGVEETLGKVVKRL
nr:hypothetical protein [Tanacetum cinerariifolium]